MKNKKKLIYILIALIIVLSTVLGLLFSGVIDFNPKQEEEIQEEEIIEEEVKQEYRELWLENKSINDDYQGEIIFKSGLINKSFVQAKSVYDKNGEPYKFYSERGDLVTDVENYNGNDVYIWTNWKDGTYDYDILGGSVFMDYRNELDDQNIIIYGHHFSKENGHDPERIKAFTPLEVLLDESNYEDNKYVDLILDNETRTYELVGVYIFDMENEYHYDNLQYWRRQYNYDDFADIVDNNYYDNYIENIAKVFEYETDVKLETTDKTLTLQTCIGGSNTKFEICVLKLINVEKY